MRLFIGIELPEDVRRSAASAADRLRRSIERAAARSVVRWVPAENLHVTVWFLGEVRDADVEGLIAALRPPLGVGAFVLRIDGAGAFPPSGPPRAIWLDLASGREGLLSVYERLRARLTPLGFEPEKRPYSPHLTIGRVKDVRRGDAPAIHRVLRETRFEPAGCEITHATLFRSRTLPDGSQYEELLRVPLI
jgi:RNA 2',3'-cyclic 3'-phosphodiesterase